MGCVRIVLVFSLFVAGFDALNAPEVLHMTPIGWAHVHADDARSEEPNKIQYQVYEVVDYGRFLNGQQFFARIDIAQFWLRPQAADEPWRSIDLTNPAACSPPLRTGASQWNGCKREYVHVHHKCTPVSLEECKVAVNSSANDFIDTSIRLENGSYVIATKLRDMYVLSPTDMTDYRVPASGVMIADVPQNISVSIGWDLLDGDTRSGRSFAYAEIRMSPLYFGSAMTLDEKLSCKSFELVGNSIECHARCAGPNKLNTYMALIATVLIVVGCGIVFAVTKVRKSLAKVTSRGDSCDADFDALVNKQCDDKRLPLE